jgi:hypothetical protein
VISAKSGIFPPHSGASAARLRAFSPSQRTFVGARGDESNSRRDLAREED